MLAALAVCMAACGGKSGAGDATQKSDDLTLKTELQEAGDLTDFASFADEMKIKIVNDQKTANEKTGEDNTIELVLLASLDVKSNVCTNYNFGFNFTIVDEDYAKIANIGSIFFDSKSDLSGNDFSAYLNKGIIRKEKKFSLTQEEWNNVLNKGKYIIIKNAGYNTQFKPYQEGRSAMNNNNYSNDDSGSEDWDSILDSYEEYVDKYISLAKKAASGDASAMSEYAELADDAQELSSKLSKAKSELSSSQLSRYTKITQKMANAAQQMR